MDAVVYHAPLDIKLQQVDILEIYAGEILFEVRAATTCGTDLKAYMRGFEVARRNFFLAMSTPAMSRKSEESHGLRKECTSQQ